MPDPGLPSTKVKPAEPTVALKAKANAAPKTAPRRNDGWRETIESVVVAFVLAFLFRTFEAEAFVIPTGSMAPTLYGQHRDVTCEKCGTRYAASASDEVREGLLDSQKRSHTAVCPNCRFPNDVLTDEIFKGDRILVNKFPYDFGTPDRWDVIVFKFPKEAKTNYIKRLVGLPGEELKIEWGDVWVRKLNTQDPFKIPRKRPEKQRTLQLPVYDDDHPPRELLEAGWPERWAAADGSGWSADAGLRAYRVDPDPLEPDRLHWLRYRHLVPGAADWTRVVMNKQRFAPGFAPAPELITDFYAYNAVITKWEAPQGEVADKFPELSVDRLGVQWVGDLTISCEVDVLAPAGELVWELVEGERRYRCRVDLKTGLVSLSYVNDQLEKLDGELVPLGDAESDMHSPGTYRVSFANVDDRLCVWINDRLVRQVEFDPGSRYAPPSLPLAPTERDLSPVGIAARGAQARISHLRLERDIYYRYAAPGNVDEYSPPNNTDDFRRLLGDPEGWFEQYRRDRKVAHYVLHDRDDDREDEFLVLGDNSPRSSDSRAWDIGPAMPRRLLIGKAFFIYWPHGVPFLNGGKGIPIAFYDERTANGIGRANPESPKFSIPFYPQVGRMRRIR